MTYDYAEQPKIDIPNCPVCGTLNTPEPRTDRYGFHVGISLCVCGFSYMSPILTPDGFADFYAHWYRPLLDRLRGYPMAPERLEARQREYGRTLSEACPEVPHTVSLLDAGGSTGAVSQGFQGMSWSQITVLDPSPDELAAAQAKGYQGILSTIEDFTPTESYDVILCAQTIDHCYDPIKALRNLHAAATPGAWLVIDYVDCEKPIGFTNGRFQTTGSADFPKIDHPCYWTQASLACALTQSGWHIQRHQRSFQGGKGLFVCRAS